MHISPLYTFISTGELTAMYTLRQMSIVTDVNSLGTKISYSDSFHIQNLSTTKDTANSKAQAISDAMGLEFRQNADFDLNEIKRLTAGEVTAEREAREEKTKAYIAGIVAKYNDDLEAGFMVVGKHLGATAQEIVDSGDIDYVLYCASQHNPENKGGVWAVNCAVCSQWLSANPQPISTFCGVVGSPLEVKVTVRKVTFCNGMYPTTMFLCVTESGDLIKFFTTAKAFDDTEKTDSFVVKGNVKAHEKDTYLDGSPQVTMINRPKMVK